MSDKVDCPSCKREIAVYYRHLKEPLIPGQSNCEVRIRVHNDLVLKMRCPGSQKLLTDH